MAARGAFLARGRARAAAGGSLRRTCTHMLLRAILVAAATSASCASLSVRDAAGNQWRAISDPADGAQGYLLEHLAADGRPDPRFGRDGRRALAISATDDAPTSVRVDARGRIWVAGASIAGGQPQAVVLRYLADGAPDLQWGVQGKVQVSPGGLAIKPNDLLPLSDGSLLVAGVAANLEPVRAVVFHLKADGALDTAFGTAGTWQRAGATDGSTATNLAVDEDGAVAACVAARGDKAAAEIWAIATPGPRLVQQQPLDPSNDGENLRVAWAGGRWVLASAGGSTVAGQAATLTPALPAPGRSAVARASAASDPGQGVFSPFAGDLASSAPLPTPAVDEAAGGRSGLWLVTLLAAVALAILALRSRRRAAQTVLRKGKP